MAAKKKPAKMCGCVAKVNKALEPENVILDTIWSIQDGNSRVYPQIKVEKREPRGPKPKKLIPIYCPFCGKKYPKS